ncbi:MarR family winged helix-turn-helix transcriptional regulator [Gordonia hydrophobica]|uniref:MarR family transcriptional regulator n=1 Tax=Gordonia hydrophobica TaxID=40516 RepID=A0ABZ2TXE7_9ACTN|nr:MarR family transcriptional regulator [Gordonia hydrophobica]MBM7366294.1 DNA-binding MarR family transcriptional regulator [Gordonia hydrophobica]
MSDESPWLSPAELAVWLKFSHLLVRVPQELDAQLRRDAGLNWYEYLALAGLSESPGRTARMSDLAVLTNGSLSRLSHVVKRLEDHGWVTRAPSPDDGRYTNASLTDAGWEKIQEAAPEHVATVRRFFVDPLTSDQLADLDHCCEAMQKALDGP